MGEVYNQLASFKKKYPKTVTHHRLKKHAEVIERHLNPGEEVLYAFAAQKNVRWVDIFETCAVVLTNERILIGQKRVMFGYFLFSITPDLYNDLQVRSGLFWGSITIDTIKELVDLSNIDKRALPEIETKITSFMMEAKKKYGKSDPI